MARGAAQRHAPRARGRDRQDGGPRQRRASARSRRALDVRPRPPPAHRRDHRAGARAARDRGPESGALQIPGRRSARSATTCIDADGRRSRCCGAWAGLVAGSWRRSPVAAARRTRDESHPHACDRLRWQGEPRSSLFATASRGRCRRSRAACLRRSSWRRPTRRSTSARSSTWSGCTREMEAAENERLFNEAHVAGPGRDGAGRGRCRERPRSAARTLRQLRRARSRGPADLHGTHGLRADVHRRRASPPTSPSRSSRT